MESQRKLPGLRRRPRAGGLTRNEGLALLDALRRDAARIAGRFGLTYRDLQPERPKAPHYGICYEEGLIKIRLQHATRGTPLKYSSLVHTLCHELAHRRHFDHGREFQAFLARILEWARRDGLYRPGRSEPSPPDGCGVDASLRRRFLRGMRTRLEGGPVAEAGTGQLDLFEPGG